jgi:hypothetical protein
MNVMVVLVVLVVVTIVAWAITKRFFSNMTAPPSPPAPFRARGQAGVGVEAAVGVRACPFFFPVLLCKDPGDVVWDFFFL